MNNESVEILRRKYEREKKAREEAEHLLEAKSLELYNTNKELKSLNSKLEEKVQIRTKELKLSESLYQSLVESISDLICKTTMDGTITYVNRVAAISVGLDQKDIIGTSIWDFIGPKNKEDINLFVQQQLNNKTCISYVELPIISHTGKEKWLGVSMQFFSKKCLNCTHKHEALMTKETFASKEQCKYDEIIFVARDISIQKETDEERKIQSYKLKVLLEQQVLISDIAITLNSLNSFDQKINNVLEVVGNHLNVSRVYIFENFDNGETTSNTFEWCHVGIDSQIDELQGIPYRYIPSWKRLLIEEGIVFTEDIYSLPQDILDILEPQGIKSIIVLPLNVDGQFYGFVGFDECVRNKKWEKSELELLRTITSIISNAYERKRIEEDLRQSEYENRTIIDSIPDMIFIHDENDKVRHSKKSALSKVFNIDDVYDKTPVEIFGEEIGQSIIMALNEARENGRFQFEYQIEENGETRYFESRMVNMDKNEVMSIVRDVTVTKQNEVELKNAKDSAVKANLSKSEFLANVSHEIRTPMNAILGFSEILLSKVEDQGYRDHLKTILSSGRTLLSLINDILDLSKIEAGKLEVEPEPMFLESVINDIEQIFLPKVEEKHLTLDISASDDIPAYIYMDEVRFHQILFNLLGNAIKFTEKGYVKLESRAVDKGDKIDLIIDVIDTGIGIPEDQHEMIFEAFSQQSGQNNRMYGGTGLGLAITKRLVEKMNGEIKLESKVGKGSVFRLCFYDVHVARNVSSNIEKRNEKVDDNIEFEPSVVMIVDDIDVNIQVAKVMLENYNIKFLEVNSGEDAIDMLELEKPDLIFMDIRMHGMSGIAATELIKLNPKTASIPVIAFTASAMQNQISKIKEIFDGYIRKPVTKKTLVQVLQKYLKYRTGDKRKSMQEPEIETLDPVCIENLPELLNMFEGDLIDKWKEISGSLVIYEIDEFCKYLEGINNDFDCHFMSSYIDELRNALESFDIDLIGNKVSEFPELYEKLKTANK